ncbi:MAG: bifunctional metallophosphatase/5'-nucleotidase, partial [Myxococcales bacterium]|nr:bifunctional metallophosphatase/5'-nucleotidase [Myxococcales bacterium]
MTRRLPLILLTCTVGLALYGCPDDTDKPDSGPAVDAGFPDTGFPDTGAPDTGAPDSGEVPDSGETPDAGFPDSGTPQAISFIHTNDEHSHHLGFSPNVDDFPDLSTSADIHGGIYRRAAVLKSLEQEATATGDAVVTVSAGDISMGSLFHIANLVQGPDYIAQTLLGYDVMTLGNHEFDFGPGILASMISQGSIGPTGTPIPLRVPLVVSNIRFSMSSAEDDALAALYGPEQPIRRTWVRRFGEVTIGFVGVMGLDAALVAPFKSPVMFSLAVNDAASCTGDADCPGSVCVPPADDPTAAAGKCALDSSGFDFATNFPALVADVASAVAEVRAQGVDIVVAVSHAGINDQEVATLQAMGLGLENAVASEEILLARGVDMALTQANIPGIDVIVGGHSHSVVPAPMVIPNARSGINTYIVQAGDYGRYVGKLRLHRDDVTLPWTLDAEASGLTTVDGTVNTSGVDRFFLDQLVNGVMDALEQAPIAQANDGLVFPGEQCDRRPDGSLVLPAGGLCENVIPGFIGNLGCHANRQLDFSGCVMATGLPSCGDTTINVPEQCDGATIPLACTDLGYTGGNMACAANCTLDVSACTVRFPSLLETALNFQRPETEAPIVYNGRGSLFFHALGTTTFDVGERQASNESNILNLVADADREIVNTLGLQDRKEPWIDVAVVANGVVRDGLFLGETGALTTADLFRVVPLGISPQERTPGYTLVDFYLTPPELKAALEVGVGVGYDGADSFWLGVSGARVEYDPSLPAFDPANPTTTGRITKLELNYKAQPWDDVNGILEPIFDANNGGFPDPTRRLHVATNLYIDLFATGLGICPRDYYLDPLPNCAPCTTDLDCTAPGGSCNTLAGVCQGGEPAAFSIRTTVPIDGGFRQELKEFLALLAYVRRLP